MINKAQQKAPNGLDWATLVADFNQINNPNPTPTPPPDPNPPPPVPPDPPPVPPDPIPPTPPPPNPIPPIPVPVPIPVAEIKAIIDGIFQQMKQNFAGRPVVEAVLSTTQALIDEYLSTLGQ
jgi:hypothetical protein